MLQNDNGLTIRNEAELVSLARSGNDAAFEELIGPAYAKCKRLAASILHDATEAEDVTQNACLRALRQLHQFRGESAFATWLARIVINQARSVRRYRHLHGLVSIDETAVTQSKPRRELREFSLNPEQQLGVGQLEMLLSREINRIPLLFRKVLILKDLQEMPLAAIAAEMNLPVQTIKTRLFRGRKELRSRMLKHGGQRVLRSNMVQVEREEQRAKLNASR